MKIWGGAAPQWPHTSRRCSNAQLQVDNICSIAFLLPCCVTPMLFSQVQICCRNWWSVWCNLQHHETSSKNGRETVMGQKYCSLWTIACSKWCACWYVGRLFVAYLWSWFRFSMWVKADIIESMTWRTGDTLKLFIQSMGNKVCSCWTHFCDSTLWSTNGCLQFRFVLTIIFHTRFANCTPSSRCHFDYVRFSTWDFVAYCIAW